MLNHLEKLRSKEQRGKGGKAGRRENEKVGKRERQRTTDNRQPTPDVQSPGFLAFWLSGLVVLAIISSSCGEGGEEGDLEPPVPPADTQITAGPGDGSVVSDIHVTFQWEGIHKFMGEFSYRCTPQQENWSDWSPDMSVTLKCLDQGDHVFEVKGRYEAGNEDDTPAQRTFTVDIPGPGVFLKPLKQEAILGEEFEIDVVADEVKDVMLAHLILKFDSARVQALDVTAGGIFQDYPLAFFKEMDNSRGVVDVSISTIGATPPRINGTGVIATIRFKSLSAGESNLDFDSGSEFRDSANSPIAIINWIGSIIEIVES